MARLAWSVLLGIIAFIVTIWITGLIDPAMQYRHLFSTLIGVAVGFSAYFKGPWTSIGPRY